MEMKIPQEIIEQTTQCTKNISCLSDKTRDVCKVLHADGVNVLFIEKNAKSCPYKIPFGSSYICSCPIRHELYTKYNI